jgi:hypothetical protein
VFAFLKGDPYEKNYKLQMFALSIAEALEKIKRGE